MTCKNTRIISYSAHISTPYLWFIALSAWCMFTHENSEPFKYQHYEYTHIITTTIINPIFPLEIARNQCHIKTLNHIKAHLRSLYMSRIGLGLITRPYRYIFVTFQFWVWGSVPPESFFSSSLILICVMGVCVGSCVSLTGVTGLTGLNKSLITESLIRSLTSKW